MTTEGKTHYYGCWRDYKHHECAICQVWRLADALAEAVDVLGTIDLAISADKEAKTAVQFIRPLVLKWHRIINEVERRASDDEADMAEEPQSCGSDDRS